MAAGTRASVWFERLDAENDNLRAALSWLLEQGEGNWRCVSAGRWVFWHVRGHLEEEGGG